MQVLRGRKLDLEGLDVLKEVEFQIFASARLEFSSAYNCCPEIGPCVLQGGLSFRVDLVYVHSEFRGGTYLVHNEGDEAASFILKTGPTDKAVKLAKAFRAYSFDWRQVNSEIKVREFLTRSSCNLSSLRIPQILHSESVVAPKEWAGRSAIVLSFEGESLASKRLPLPKVEEMGCSLVTTVATLQAYGVFHCDICPRNVAYDEEKHKFCLLDFGAAAFGTSTWDLSNNITDMRFGPMDVVLWGSKIPQRKWEFESVLYTMLEVAGLELPWSSAAETLQLDRVRQLRKDTLNKHSLLGAYNVELPPLFHALERLVLGHHSVDTMLKHLGLSQLAEQGKEQCSKSERRVPCPDPTC